MAFVFNPIFDIKDGQKKKGWIKEKIDEFYHVSGKTWNDSCI